MSGGATAITQVFMRDMLRQMERERSRRDIKINAYRMAHRTLYKDGVFSSSQGKSRMDYACYFLCGKCGYLVEKAKTSCPSCGVDSWLDLGDTEVAENLREIESEERTRIPKAASFALGASLVLAYIIYIFFVVWLNSVFFINPDAAFVLRALLLALVIGFMLFFFNKRRAAKLYYRLFPRKRPLRWRVPLVEIKKKQVPLAESRGKAKALSPLISPFSGTPCIGYKAAILFDARGDAKPPEWILAESKVGDFEVNDGRISGERALVKSKLKLVSEEVVVSNLGDLSVYLRKRGLFHVDGEFEFFEAVVRDGGDIVVLEFEGAKTIALQSA